ncbi:MAG: pyruvate dehydrogenase complex E1 component subunit beta [Candidatus Lindowbacteria bacterium]|nr:pyruvate dehydrogenase complex E1 component subunit beta [Candidatus Lindowbacteria bacterium]
MTEIRYREALRDAHAEEMRRDSRVFVMGEEIAVWGGSFRVTEGLLEEFGPERVIDTPISEEVIVGAGIGAAMAGLRPIVELMTINFSLLAMDQIINHAAKLYYMSGGQLPIPMVIRAPEGAGQQLGAQHSQNLEAHFVHTPGLKVVAPSTPADAKGLLKTCVRDDDPIMFIEHEVLYGMKGEVPDDDDFTIPLGVADIKRAGSDVTIVAYSRMVHTALEAAKQLEKDDGISIEIVDPRTLKPFDIDAVVRSVEKTGRLIIVEEDCRTCGVGAEIAASVGERAFYSLDAPVLRVAGADVPIPYSRHLEQSAIPQPEDVVHAVKRILSKK